MDLVRAVLADVAAVAVIVVGGVAAYFLIPSDDDAKTLTMRVRLALGVVIVVAVGVLAWAAYVVVIDS